MNLKFGVLAGTIVAVTMGLSGQAMAGTDEEQLARMKDPDQWPAPGRDFELTRHSTLSEINTKNVNKLQMIWLQGTNALRGHEGQPLVIKDVGGKTMLFMISGCPAMSNCNVVQALDLTDPDNPKQVWNYVKKTDRDESAVPRAFLTRTASSCSGRLTASSSLSTARPARKSGWSSTLIRRKARPSRLRR